MYMYSSFVLFGVCLLLLPLDTAAQIPAACTDANSLKNLQCCPVTAHGMCGMNANRGTCVSLSHSGYSTKTSDVRKNWPHYFTRVCQCNGNYAGYDCSQCKFGHYGADCSKFQVLPRQPIASYSDQDWADYNDILNKARKYDSGYVAVMEESVPGNTSIVTVKLSIYNYYIWIHHYTAKDSHNGLRPRDYSHFGPAFFTWHRMFNLWLEWEIQRMLKEMGRSDYHTFRLPYWDWRVAIQKSPIGITIDDLLTENKLGYTKFVKKRPLVVSSLVNSGWSTICWQLTVGSICDPRVNTGPLTRCPYAEPCSVTNKHWPTIDQVYKAMEYRTFDAYPYNAMSTDGFRNWLDFSIGHDRAACKQNGLCYCMFSSDCSSSTVDKYRKPITVTTQLHSLVHYLLGIGDALDNEIRLGSRQGTFNDVAASPNDPVFILHHAMVDCVLNEWQKRHPKGQYPDSRDIVDGHKRDDFIRVFFPLFTNNDMFVNIEKFGYTCNLPDVDR